ncbi:MAG: 1-deoxy-D-xylulose-5-phosphate synthase [Spirochaetia bacterium]|jgi:1-deoxy-D-xylulose-5-phosphate synthase|nr:1-deoxy-D-xylulose-5-phosphate synthase [Spirochaetia bacterium]
MKQKPLLNRINSPDNLKELPLASLPDLAKEIRNRIIEVVDRNGGHMASNLGVVELTIAMHRVFTTPEDQFVWDVGHQCYTHKLLTGRNESFESIRLKDGLSGFPKRDESIHDIVETGHASTSISASLGLLVGKRLKGEKGKVVAVIGDGAITGGMAFEALNHSGHLRKDLIIIYNDNNMSISRNVGGLSSRSAISKSSSYVSRITATRYYQRIRDNIDKGLLSIPFLGYRIFQFVMRMKRGVKALFFKETIFSDLGFEYVGPIDGHSISMLTKVLENVKKLQKPVIVHVVTKKGKGYTKAEENPSDYHGVSPIPFPVDIIPKNKSTYTDVFGELLTNIAAENKSIIAITAAMAKGTGLIPFQNKFPDRFFDVGIAEQHAVTFGAGLAASGFTPVIAIYSTFMQRAVDQLIHDIAIPGLPAIIAMDRSGMVSSDGETHQGAFDIAIFSAIPSVVIMAPGSSEEFQLMLNYAIESKKTVLFRYPKAECPVGINGIDSPLEIGRGVFIKHTYSRILLITLGGLVSEAISACEILADKGVDVDLYNLRFIKPLDKEYLIGQISDYSHVFLVEDGSRRGGVGEYIASLIAEKNKEILFQHIGMPDHFLSQALRSELLVECGLSDEGIAASLLGFVKKNPSVNLKYKEHQLV